MDVGFPDDGRTGGIFTIGHSTRTAEAFIDLLRDRGVDLLADIRQYPGSRRLPHFNREPLRDALARAGVDYEWHRELGGRRSPPAEKSVNTGLRNASFRNYADYMGTPAFRAAIERLVTRSAGRTVAIMCAEVLYWRCHRRLVSDYLVAHGVPVLHIVGPGPLQPHRMTQEARIVGGELCYPQPAADPMIGQGILPFVTGEWKPSDA
jgi:uncharacterized protein (DUF488 family)